MRGFLLLFFLFSILIFVLFVSWNNSTLAVFYHVTTLTLFISIVVVIFLVAAVVGTCNTTGRFPSGEWDDSVGLFLFFYFLTSFSLV